jgi:hypothetical protein
MSWLLHIVLAFGVAVLAHALYVRLAPNSNRLFSFLAIGTLVGLRALAYIARHFSIVSAETLAAALLYAFLCELYIFLFSSSLTSISMNILIRLLFKPIPTKELEQDYSGEAMVRIRIERLLGTNMLERVTPESIPTLTARGQGFLDSVGKLRKFFRHTTAVTATAKHKG